VTYVGDGRYGLSPEQVEALADEESPYFLSGTFQTMVAATRITPKLVEAFRTGAGVGWAEHDADLFEGTERGFRPGYKANLVSTWIPALDSVEAKLQRGASMADIGCGYGASTILLALAFPNSSFVGFDFHAASIAEATRKAASAGMSDRVRFEVATARTYPGSGYDLVACFDCLHDMGDPVGASRHVLETLDVDGTWLIVEPYAGDKLEDNLTPLGRMGYAASTLICTPDVARTRGRGRARFSGGRNASARGGYRRRVHALSPRGRDALQSCARGATLSGGQLAHITFDFGCEGRRLRRGGRSARA
jgi:SAM-dependent methyltransferase